IGAFFIPPLLAFVLLQELPLARRLLLGAVLMAAALVPFLPYAAYVLPHWQEFRGQSRTVEQRTDLLLPSFYLENLKGEPKRYEIGAGLQKPPATLRDVMRRPSARLALLIVGPLAA